MINIFINNKNIEICNKKCTFFIIMPRNYKSRTVKFFITKTLYRIGRAKGRWEYKERVLKMMLT